jgi:hypothetical protein
MGGGKTAIQWHISLHSGSSLDGASGSVRITVNGPLVFLEQEIEMFGSDLVDETFNVDPSFMLSDEYSGVRWQVGLNEERTSGTMEAELKLVYYQ